MKKIITQKNFIIRNTLNIIILDLLFFLTANIINLLNPITLFIIPLISIKLSSLISSANKEIVKESNDNFKNQLLISEFIATIISYFLLFHFNIIVFLIYLLGAFIGHLISVKSIENKISKETPQESSKDSQTNSNNSIDIASDKVGNDYSNIIKSYKMEKFDDNNVIKFLNMNNLDSSKYFIASQQPEGYSFLLYGNLAALTITYYIVYFDSQNILLFQLSTATNRNIVNLIKLNRADINEIKFKDDSFANLKVITIKFKDKKDWVLSANKKLKKFEHQSESLEEFEHWFN